MNQQFWQKKRVLITGHTGFKGSWLSLWLQAIGANLVGYAQNPPTNPSLFEVADVGKGMESEIGDIRDLDRFLGLLDKYRPEIVIHMAAQTVVRASYVDPVETYDSNVMGTVKVLEAIRRVGGVRACVVVTSDKCYENKEWLWGYRESDSLGGYDPYSNSKGCAELVVSAYRNSFFNVKELDRHGVRIATARAGNVIGGGDWTTDQLFPDMVRAFQDSKPVRIRNPHAVRPWQCVLEPLDGYLTLAEYLWNADCDYGQAWNFGPHSDSAKSVGWIVDHVAAKWGQGASWQTDAVDHPHEANYLKLDSSMAAFILKWKPRLTLQQGLDWAVEWYRAYAARSDMRSLTIKQIEQFQQLS